MAKGRIPDKIRIEVTAEGWSIRAVDRTGKVMGQPFRMTRSVYGAKGNGNLHDKLKGVREGVCNALDDLNLYDVMQVLDGSGAVADWEPENDGVEEL